MNAKKFSDAMSEIDNKYIDEAISYKARKKNRWIKWGGTAACLFLVISSIFMLSTNHDGKKVIRQYQNNSEDCYAIPSSGEVNFTSEVMEAREKYDGKNVVFLLAFNLFKDDNEVSDEERIEEYERLISLGYELYTAEYWTYYGQEEKEYHTIVVGYFTESQLSLFKNNPEYGYFFYFVHNGNGSGISVDEENIITDFPTNHS